MILCVSLLRFGFSRYMRLDHPESQGKVKPLLGILTPLSSLSELIMKYCKHKKVLHSSPFYLISIN